MGKDSVDIEVLPMYLLGLIYLCNSISNQCE